MSLVIREEEPPDDAVVVVRGGLAASEPIRRTAEVSMGLHGSYGVSVFLAWGMTVDELVQRTAELSPGRYKQLRTSTVAAVRSGGFRLLASGEWPHYDIVSANLGDETIEALRGCFGPPLANPGGSETMEGPGRGTSGSTTRRNRQTD